MDTWMWWMNVIGVGGVLIVAAVWALSRFADDGSLWLRVRFARSARKAQAELEHTHPHGYTDQQWLDAMHRHGGCDIAVVAADLLAVGMRPQRPRTTPGPAGHPDIENLP